MNCIGRNCHHSLLEQLLTQHFSIMCNLLKNIIRIEVAAIRIDTLYNSGELKAGYVGAMSKFERS